MKKFLSIIGILILSNVAQAHYIWIERDAQSPARAYFGEWSEDVKEKTGGSLDKIDPKIFTDSEKKRLKFTRQEDHLEAVVKKAGDVRLISQGAPREDKKEGGKSRTIFYAKEGRQDIAPKMDMEFVPTQIGGSEFILIFRGAPLAKADVTVYGPPKWEKPLSTDENGKVTIPTPWAGRYVVKAYYTENQASEVKGEKVDRTRHASTMSFVTAN